MKVTIRLHEGMIEGLTVLDPETKDVLFRMEHRAMHLSRMILVDTPQGLRPYNIIRTELGKAHPVKVYVKAIRDNLEKHYGIFFQGLLWGSPDHMTHDGKVWFAVGNQLAITADGEMSMALAESITRYGRDPLTINLTPLLEFISVFLPNKKAS